jgi:hypothetical protein
VKLLELPLFAATRRNHALEHATIHILSERHPDLRLVGRSDWTGFTLYGPVDTNELAEVLASALQRLQGGESQLAVHPRCGTNVATGMVLAGLASTAALSGRRRSRLEKTLQLALGLGAALALAQPLGAKLQEHITTSSDVANLRVAKILRLERGVVVVHRIETAQE